MKVSHLRTGDTLTLLAGLGRFAAGAAVVVLTNPGDGAGMFNLLIGDDEGQEIFYLDGDEEV